jgi:hypothetical protein
MLNNLKDSPISYVQKAMDWVDPAWWIVISICLLVLCIIHFLPLELKAENHNFNDRVLVFLRRGFLIVLVGLGAVFPFILYVGFGMSVGSGNKDEASRLMKDWYMEMFAGYYTFPLAAIILGVTINFCWHRYMEPYLSQVRRKLRVNQVVDEQSDIRAESTKYARKTFDPETYFRPDQYFFGLDSNNEPVYVPAATFESTQTISIAPTGFGKGVIAGCLLTQAVRRGNTVFMVDPKGDQRLPHILQAEAKRMGVPFIYLDLNPEGKGNWAPFKGGSERDRRSRMQNAFGLSAGGTNADVYKTKERSILDKVMKSTDGSINAMYEAVTALTDKDGLSELRDGLGEWAQISTFASSRKRKGHSIEASLLNNAVVYVKGSLTDTVVNKATRCYVSELIQEAKRLISQRTTHLTVFVDETRFVTSKEIVDALATMREFRANMMLATQAISDLRVLEDKTIDGPALQKSVEINCQIKNLYRAGDNDTAEWAEGLTGTKWVRSVGNEKTEVNRWGGEKWDKMRSFNSVEVPLFHRNVFLAIPQMVSVVFQPGQLPRETYSSWMKVDMSNPTWEAKEPVEVEPENAPSQLENEVAPATAAPAAKNAAPAAVNVTAAVSVKTPAQNIPPQNKQNGNNPAKPVEPKAPNPNKPKARGNPKLAQTTQAPMPGPVKQAAEKPHKPDAVASELVPVVAVAAVLASAGAVAALPPAPDSANDVEVAAPTLAAPGGPGAAAAALEVDTSDTGSDTVVSQLADAVAAPEVLDSPAPVADDAPAAPGPDVAAAALEVDTSDTGSDTVVSQLVDAVATHEVLDSPAPVADDTPAAQDDTSITTTEQNHE